jgi:hypothetical protein
MKKIHSSDLTISESNNRYRISIGTEDLKTPDKGTIVESANLDFIEDIVAELMKFPVLEIEKSAIKKGITGPTLYNLYCIFHDAIGDIKFGIPDDISEWLLADSILHSVAGPEIVDQIVHYQPIENYLEKLGVTNPGGLLFSGLSHEKEFHRALSYDEKKDEYSLSNKELGFERFCEILNSEWVNISKSQKTAAVRLALNHNSIVSALCLVNYYSKASEYANIIQAANAMNYVFGLEDETDENKSSEEIHTDIYRELFEEASICLNFLNHTDDDEKLKSVIRSGETEVVEFKETLCLDVKRLQNDKNYQAKKESYLAEETLLEIPAFLNHKGGTIFVGVTDDGSITGVDKEIDTLFDGNKDKYLLYVTSNIKDKIEGHDSEDISYELKTLRGKTLLIFYCKKLGPESECYINAKLYERRGPSSEIIEGKKLADWLKKRQKKL